MILSTPVKYLLRYLALAYITILVIVPVGLILWRTFTPGVGAFFESITTPAALSALQLSLLVVAIVVPLNVLFGMPTALVLARNRFRGKSALQAVIDLPFAVSPVVVGVALILLWGSAGLFGFVENDLGFKIIFGFPGIVLASIFVTVPFVIREVEPVLHEDRHRSGRGRVHAGIAVVADVLADHAAIDPVGADVRHRPDDRPHPRRVRRGHHGVVQPAGNLADPHTVGRRPLQPRSGVRRVCHFDAADDRGGGSPDRSGDPRRPASTGAP